jgi:UDP-glucuronate 4-epimerase
MRILVTGSSGFIGLALTTHCVVAGDHVTGLDRRGPGFAKAELDAGPGSFRFIEGDCADRALIGRVIEEADAVVAAAAITSGAAREARDGEAILRVNLFAVQTLLEALCATPRRMICLSSGSVYDPDDPSETLDEETARLAPRSLYQISKFAAEGVALRYRDLHRLDICVVRLGSAFGPWEHDTGVRDTLSPMFHLMRAHLKDETPLLVDSAPKDWTYSVDIAEQLRLILATERPPHPVVNLGSGRVWSARDFAAALGQNLDAPALKGRRPMAIRRLIETTGRPPRFGLAEAVSDYLAWSRRHPAAFG